MEAMEFSLILNSRCVVLMDATKKKKNYVIKELDGTARDAYMNGVREKAEFDAKGNVLKIKTFEGSQSGLLSLCLYDDSNTLVTEEEIQKFPSHVLSALHTEAQRLSDLQVKEVKNESSASD